MSIDERPDSYVLTIHEVADRLKVSDATVSRMVGRGEVPVIRVGRAVRVPKMAFERWFEKHSRRAA
jgi:excisionase family DNA binding protein